MKYSILIDPGREEEIVIYAHEKTRLVERSEELILGDRDELIGYRDRGAVMLDAADVICFSVDDGKVCAVTKQEKLLVKQRLYQLEERFASDFLKINQSCLVRVDRIKRFDSSIGGALMVTLDGGYRDYVSRRQMKTVKERMGL